MKTNLLKVKRLKDKTDLNLLSEEGDFVIISVGSGNIRDTHEYRGPVAFIGETLKGDTYDGFDFCRHQANLGDCLVGYHLPKNKISITREGVISSPEFATYGCKYDFMKNSEI